MATSGSTDYSLNAREIIDYALKKLRVLGAGETAGSEEALTAQRELNLMLKGWQRYPSLWRLTQGVITLVPDTYTYTLTPAPHKVISMRYRNDGGSDLPMSLMEREEYFDLPIKTGSGIPTQYYVDYQRSSATLYLWQSLASVTTETIQYTYQRKFEDIDSLDNDLDVRTDWLDVVGYNLAYRLGPDFGRVGSAGFAEIKEQAIVLKEEMLDDDREETVRFVPGYGEYPWP